MMSGHQETREITVHAPAKINLVLRVLDRQPNGYHALWSLMHTVALVDDLTLKFDPQGDGVTLHCLEDTVPIGPENLVCRAAQMVLARSGIKGGVDITLTKRIPVSAGLGGGSSDAAATISGLNTLLDLGWSPENMAAFGATLGSDIPFFFVAPSAVVQGWGQKITAVHSLGTKWVVLVNPGFPIETKAAFQQLAKGRGEVKRVSGDLLGIHRRGQWSWKEILPLMENDFESALFPQYKTLGQIKANLLTMGAQGALLSGSGATVFGIFGDQRTALQAQTRLQKNAGWRVFAISTR